MAVEQLDLAGATIAPGLPERSHAPPIPPITSTVAAFLGRAERGPASEPVEIHSVDDYRRVFGGHCTFSCLPDAVQHFFLNGGRMAVVVRLVNRATRAAIDVPAGGQALRLKACRPGSREILRLSVDYDGVEDDADRFNLVVQRLTRPGSSLIEDQELFPALSLSPDDPRFVVDVLQQSKLVSVVGPLPTARPEAIVAKHPGYAIPYLDFPRPGSDGEELTDYDIVGSNREGTGLFALDRVERFDFLCIPAPPGRDIGTTTFVAAERYCERRRAMLIWDPPWAWGTADEALLGFRAAGLTSPNVLTYFPRLRPRAGRARQPAGQPACGAIAGTLAVAAEEGVWRRDPELRIGNGLAVVSEIGDRQAEALRRCGVNTLRPGAGGAIRLAGNACLEPRRTVASSWQRLDLRRTALHVLGSLERATGWALHDPGRGYAAARLKSQARAFLDELRARGAFAGREEAEAYFVRVRRLGADLGGGLLLRFGIAMSRRCHFEIYEIHYGPEGVKTRAVPPLEEERAAG